MNPQNAADALTETLDALTDLRTGHISQCRRLSALVSRQQARLEPPADGPGAERHLMAFSTSRAALDVHSRLAGQLEQMIYDLAASEGVVAPVQTAPTRTAALPPADVFGLSIDDGVLVAMISKRARQWTVQEVAIAAGWPFDRRGIGTAIARLVRCGDVVRSGRGVHVVTMSGRRRIEKLHDATSASRRGTPESV